MNTRIILFSLAIAGISHTATAKNDNDSLGLPGDNLDLKGALELFKKSENPEEFEKALNSESNEVNNLDLNGDNEIDYIRVVDHSKDDAHALVLQVPLNETEAQDVAVIELEKNGSESADVQIIGDEDFYGKNYIIEPAPTADIKTTVVVNVWTWPCVRHIYGPKYVLWVSPWHWHYYPVWWKPWRPVFWHIHHKRVIRYHHVHWHRVHTHRVVKAHTVYAPHRRVSKTVVHHHRGPARNVSPKPGRKANTQPKGAQKVSRKPGAKPAHQGGKAAKAGGRGKSGGGKGR